MSSGRWRRRLAVVATAVVLAGCTSVMRGQTGEEFVDDSVITAKVKARLAQEAGVRSLDISVDTFERVVVLSGFVESQGEREQAVAAARDVDGVREVKADALVVRPERRY